MQANLKKEENMEKEFKKNKMAWFMKESGEMESE